MRLIAIALLLASACTYETSGESLYTEHVRVAAGACPPAEVVLDSLYRDWVGPGFESDGDACHTEEILDVTFDRSMEGTGCCYPTSCTDALAPEQELDLYYAACLHLSCEHINYDIFSAQRARDRLVEYGLPCTVTADTAAPQNDIACLYRTQERWSCSSEGG